MINKGDLLRMVRKPWRRRRGKMNFGHRAKRGKDFGSYSFTPTDADLMLLIFKRKTWFNLLPYKVTDAREWREWRQARKFWADRPRPVRLTPFGSYKSGLGGWPSWTVNWYNGPFGTPVKGVVYPMLVRKFGIRINGRKGWAKLRNFNFKRKKKI